MTSGVEVAALAAGILGVVVALFSPAILSTVAMMAAVAAIVLGIAALTARKGHRKPLAIWALGLAVAASVSALAIFGVVVGSGYAVVIFVLPTLIGLTAIAFSIARLNRRGDRGKRLAISGLVLGAVTIVTCVWGIVNVNRDLKEPNVPPVSQTKPTMFGALDTSGT